MSKRQYLKSILKANTLRNFGVFFVLALLFLFLSKFTNDYTETLIFEIRLDGLEEEIVDIDDQIKTIKATVTGSGLDMFSYTLNDNKNIKLRANFDVKKQDNKYVCYPDILQKKILDKLSSNTSIRLLSEDTLVFNYKKSYSKIVPVRLKQNINFEANFDLVKDFKLLPDSVKIVGSEKELKEIKYITTEALTKNQVKSDFNETVRLSTTDFNNISVFPKEIQVSASVKKYTDTSVKVPIELINTKENINFNIEPKYVVVNFKVNTDSYKRINSKDFEVILDVSKFDELNTNFWVPELLKQPSIVKQATIKQPQISVIKL